MWIRCAALLALSAATSPAPARSFAAPAPLTAAATARRRATGFPAYRAAQLRPAASKLGQQERTGQQTKVAVISNHVTANKNLDIGIISVEDDDCYQSRLRRLAYYVFQVPLYALKFPVAILLGIWSALFWRTPNESDVVAFVEGTGVITVLNRGFPAGEQPLVAPAAPASTASRSEDKEQRHYYVDVKRCSLDHVIREPGKEFVTPIDSWSMSYTKTRPIASSSAGSRSVTETGKWAIDITSFAVNGKAVVDPASQMSFLHLYATMSTHTKCHVYGNTLVHRIIKDEVLADKLMESTWNTIWLHRGLLHGGLGPLTTLRTEANKWTGLASPCTAEGLITESLDMSPLGGCDHGLAKRWIDLDLPLSHFMLNARQALRRVMRDHDIPMELLEAVFLSVVMHAIDHVLGIRYMWGLRFELDLWEQPARRPMICESAVWNFIWITPTINPLYNNKIRCIPKPFYRQLYREIKKIDTLNVADEITASIMY